jgi:hypothetical protein
VFLAEPVGSCTDLRASVAYPLRRLYGDRFSVAPLSVLVDPVRSLRILGLESGKVFAPKVVYVYRKQIEEADVIVINKSDLVDSDRLHRLEDALAVEFPRAEIFAVSALHSRGLDRWFQAILAAICFLYGADLDYDVRGRGGSVALVQCDCSPYSIEAVLWKRASGEARVANSEPLGIRRGRDRPP